MKTHLLRSGMNMPMSQESSHPLCKTNRGHVVPVTKDPRFCDCGVCLRIHGNREHADQKADPSDIFDAQEAVVHFGDGEILGPDERAFCRRRPRDIADAQTSSIKEDVTCKTCLSKI